MQKLFIPICILIFGATIASGQQAPLIAWQHVIGADTSDQLYSIEQTNDGGYILGGVSISNLSGDKTESCLGGFDYWIIKVDSLGNMLWQNTIGGSDDDILACIKQTDDGGYIIGGFSKSNTSGDKTENSQGNNDYWIVKTDSAGNVLWQNTIGGANDDRLYSVVPTGDGGYFLGGYSRSNVSGDKSENCSGYSDYWIVKTDSAGIIQWQNTIGGSAVDQLETVLQTTDGGYMLGGRSTSDISGDKTENSNGVYDYWIVKTDSTGNIQWQNNFGGTDYDLFTDIYQTADGGYILAGYSTSDISGDKTEATNGMEDFWILKTDASGNIQWQNTIGGSNSDIINSIEQTGDGGYILGGWSRSGISGDKTENNCISANDFWVVKIDSAGNLLWQNTIGGDQLDQLYAARETDDGGYILGGYSNSTVSCDKNENTQGGFDFWLVKLYPDTITGIADPMSSPEGYQTIIYPNPAADLLNIAINKNEAVIITNVIGETVIENRYSVDAETTSSLNISALPAGVYFVKTGSAVMKFVKQ